MRYKKILLSFIFILVIILIYTIYKDKIIFKGTQNDFYKKYYYVFFVLISFLSLFLFLKKNYTEYLFIGIFSLLISFYLTEFYLTIKYNHNSYNKYKNKNNFDPTSLIDKLKKNDYIIFTIFPSIYLKEKNNLFPFSGISESETLHCNENGYFSNYVSDRYGFNNPDKEWDGEKIGYLTLGDSYVHGACVNRPDDISSQLRILSNKKVLNLGYSGNGPLLQFSTLREYGFLNVENILWFFFEGNDLSDLKNEIKSSVLIKYLNDDNFSQNLKNRQSEIDELGKKYLTKHNDKIIKYYENSILKIAKKKKFESNFLPKFIKFLKITNTRESLTIYKNNEIKFKEFKIILSKAKKIARDKGANFYFIYIPEYNRYRTNYKNNSYNKIKKIVNELNINLIDLHESFFSKDKNPTRYYPFNLDGHFTEMGYHEISKHIYNYINK